MILFLTLAMLFSFIQAEDDPPGRWTGAIYLPNLALEIHVTLERDAEQWTGSIDIPQQGASGIPLEKITWNEPSINFEFPAGPGLAVFEGSYESDKIEGVFKQATFTGKFSLRRMTEEKLAAEAEHAAGLGDEVVLPLDRGQLSGALLVPKSDAEMPVVLIIPGSGPTDQDGNTIGAGKNNSLKMLAEALSDNGVASLRINKRGLAGSASALANEADLRFSDYVRDTRAWCELLKGDARFSKLFIAGHSEGSLVGLMSAESCGADGFISLAGMGRTMGDVLREQLTGKLPDDLMEESLRIIEALESKEMVDDVSLRLSSLFRPSVQPYLASVISIDPAAELSKLEIASLILQGDTDLQVKLSDAGFLSDAAKDGRLRVVEGMNHVLKIVSGNLAQQMPSYTNPELPLSIVLIDEIIAFIQVEVEGSD